MATPSSQPLTKKALDKAEGTLLITDRAGKAVYANEAVGWRTGFSLAEIIGKKPGTLWGGKMPSYFYRDLWETLTKREEAFVGLVENRRKNRDPYQEELFIAPIQGQDSEPAYFLAMKPDGRSGDSEEFTQELRQAFSPKSDLTVHAFTNWLSRWFRVDLSRPLLPLQTVEAFIRETFVLPISEQFRERSLDSELVRSAKLDPAVFRLLYEKYHPKIFGYFLRHLSGDRGAAEDLTQDVFYRAFQYLEKYEVRNAAYGTYLLRIAHNLLVNHYRGHRDLALPKEELPERPHEAEYRDLVWLWETPVLPLREREALTLFYRDGYSVREIATFWGKSENAVKLLLSRARKRLRALLGA